MAVVEKVPLMGGEFELVRLSQRPETWYFRYYVRAVGHRRRDTWFVLSGQRKEAKRNSVRSMSGGNSRPFKKTVDL